jgi:hypothetical protein
MKFIPITDSDGAKTWINFDLVISFGARQKDERARSWIAVGDDETFYAKETTDEILALLAEST